MSKTKHTFAKRQREIEKKRKADEKRARRREKGQNPAETVAETPESGEAAEVVDAVTTGDGSAELR